MPDIIRRATIVLGLETGDVKIDVPDFAPIERELESTLETVETGIEEVSIQLQKLSETTLKATEDVVGSTAAMGEGFILLGRSIALFTASSEEDFRRMIQQLLVLQAGVDALRGSILVFQNIRVAILGVRSAIVALTVAFGSALPVYGLIVIAVAAIAAVFLRSTAAADHNTDSLDKNSAAAEENRRAQEKLRRELATIAGVDLQEFDFSEQAKKLDQALKDQEEARKQRLGREEETGRETGLFSLDFLRSGTFGGVDERRAGQAELDRQREADAERRVIEVEAELRRQFERGRQRRERDLEEAERDVEAARRDAPRIPGLFGDQRATSTPEIEAALRASEAARIVLEDFIQVQTDILNAATEGLRIHKGEIEAIQQGALTVQ